MTHYDLIHTEQYKGFDINFYAAYEDMHPRDHFDETEFNINELCQKINDGEYVWFIAKVTASKNGIELADDYLGGCLYENAMQFVKDNDYYFDMCERVVEQAKANIELLVA